MWQRPYTLLEIQHKEGAVLEPLEGEGEGVVELVMEGGVGGRGQSITDPDGFNIRLT